MMQCRPAYRADVGILQLLDELPEAIAQRPGRVWNVFARSLGEQGGAGCTALSWRWALTGACPSPVTLTPSAGRPPVRDELFAEAGNSSERAGADPGGQVLHARFALRWLAGELDALPLWNGGQENLHVTDGADYAHGRADIEAVYGWALLARLHNPAPGESGPDAARVGFGWGFGTQQLLAWVCGEAAEGPLSGMSVAGRPSLYQAALNIRRAMTALIHVREDGQPAAAAPLGSDHRRLLVAGGVESATTC